MLMLKMIDVVAAIIEQDGQILLAQRPPHADQPGMWEFAGGKVEPGESQPQALARELQEEMGIIARLAISLAISGRSPAAGSICTPGGCRTFRARRWPTITLSCAGAFPQKRWPSISPRPIFLCCTPLSPSAPPFPSADPPAASSSLLVMTSGQL